MPNERELIYSTLNALFGASDDIIAAFRLDGLCVYANASGMETLNLAVARPIDDPATARAFTLGYPDWRADFGQVAGTGKPLSRSLLLPIHSHAYQSCTAIIAPGPNSAGIVDSVICRLHRITDSATISEYAHLVRSEERYRRLVEVSPDAILLTVGDSIVFVNAAAIKLHRADVAEEILGKSIFHFVHPDSREAVVERRRQMQSTSKPQAEFEIKMVRVDGSIGEVESCATIVPYDTGTAILVILRDITARKTAERNAVRLTTELQARIAEQKAIFEFMPVPVAVAMDPNLKHIRINPAMQAILGVSRGHNASVTSLNSDNAPYRILMNGSIPDVGDLPMQVAVAERRVIGATEMSVIRNDGTERGLLAYAAPLYDTEGQVRGSLGAFVDITERKQTEKQLAASYDRERVINRIGAMIRTSKDIVEIQRIATTELAMLLVVDGCYLSSVDFSAGISVVEADWHQHEQPSWAGEWDISNHAAALRETYIGGKTIVVHDLSSSSLSAEMRAVCSQVHHTSMIAVPFVRDQLLTGFFTVYMRDSSRYWLTEEIKLVEAVALQVRTAIENERQAQREHNIAVTLQNALQPTSPCTIPGVECSAFYKAALDEATVGGDFHDLFALDPTHYVVVIGDISGKGLAAAAQVATVRNMLRYSLYSGSSFVDQITCWNKILTDKDLLTGFTTAFIGIYSTETCKLRYISCGHDAGLLRKAATGEIDQLTTHDPAIGVDGNAVFHQQTAILNAGDALVLYTDGISEAGAGNSTLFGSAGITRLLGDPSTHELSARQLNDRIVAAAEEYASGVLRDDVCLVTLVAER